MQRLTVGMSVKDVRGWRVGTVPEIHSCCFEVQGERFRLNLTAESIYNVEAGEVTLICDRDECSRYACAAHAPD
jgi:hypothetical protein